HRMSTSSHQILVEPSCRQLRMLIQRHLAKGCRCCLHVVAVSAPSSSNIASRTIPLCSNPDDSCLSESSASSDKCLPMSASDLSILDEAAVKAGDDEYNFDDDCEAAGLLNLLSLSKLTDNNCDEFVNNDGSASAGRASSTPVPPGASPCAAEPELELSMAEPLNSATGQDSLMESVPNRSLLCKYRLYCSRR
ncbi:hypothetical protein BOX15_Mlig024550g1, partial [Macrostomum lignano]